ncbi:MAG: response regulator [Candidatus Wallbacteria bacterium]|nr:response regulator [Candidatus Wallbacteria bacterium]
MKVLLAEDDPVSLRVLEVQVRRLGHETISSTDGQHALDTLAAGASPTMLICDWRMPRLNGPELCAALASRPEIRPAFVLLLSADAGHAELEEALRAGADDALAKPVEMSQLQLRLRLAGRLEELRQEVRALRERARQCPSCGPAAPG